MSVFFGGGSPVNTLIDFAVLRPEEKLHGTFDFDGPIKKSGSLHCDGVQGVLDGLSFFDWSSLIHS